jgi:hypothetical protein
VLKRDESKKEALNRTGKMPVEQSVVKDVLRV